MKREFSAGGVVFNDQGQVLLIIVDAAKRHYWEFPKGHIDGDETTKVAALREVEEEAGIKTEIADKIDISKYIYTSRTGEKIFKVVTFFLMKYLNGEPKPMEGEIAEVGWFTPQEAMKKLSFAQDKQHLAKALEMLS
ncbi:NUDIX hydrolase [Candidatus Microgenomates bacterium]|nr:NUDIX hydrolase [Candidatus Microgenomates bacterium]